MWNAFFVLRRYVRRFASYSYHLSTHVRSSANARTFIAQRTYVHRPTHVRAFYLAVIKKKGVKHR